MDGIILRTAKPEDAEAIARNNQAMALETEDKDLDWNIVFPGVKAIFEDASRGFYLVAESGGCVIGNLMITFEWSDWRNCNLWWFQSVYLDPAFRSQGIFSRMYHHITGLAREAGVKELRLYVEKENQRAQAVYRKLGMNASHYLMFDTEL